MLILRVGVVFPALFLSFSVLFLFYFLAWSGIFLSFCFNRELARGNLSPYRDQDGYIII